MIQFSLNDIYIYIYIFDECLGAKLRVTENRCVLFDSFTYIYIYIYIYISLFFIKNKHKLSCSASEFYFKKWVVRAIENRTSYRNCPTSLKKLLSFGVWEIIASICKANFPRWEEWITWRHYRIYRA